MKTSLGLLSSSLVDAHSKDQYQQLKEDGKTDNDIAVLEE
jgi:hypothetical protein